MRYREIIEGDVLDLDFKKRAERPTGAPPEGSADVTDLRQHKTEKAVGNYLDGVAGIYAGETDFFSQGKFLPFAKAFIDSGFNREFAPVIALDIHFAYQSNWKISPAARELRDALRRQGFKYEAGAKFHLASRPKHPNPENPGWGAPWMHKEDIDLRTAQAVFQARDASPYGLYQPSRSGFRTASKNNWDDRGVGFHLTVSGYDPRRPDKYGRPTRQETHIIDDDKDMAEVSEMFAAIARAKITTVK